MLLLFVLIVWAFFESVCQLYKTAKPKDRWKGDK